MWQSVLQTPLQNNSGRYLIVDEISEVTEGSWETSAPVSTNARSRFDAATVGVLATVNNDGSPNLVPITYALVGNKLVTGVDHKPKRTTDLVRLANIRHNPHVTVLVQHYEPDWSKLWWARADGKAIIVNPGHQNHGAAAELLADRYRQYRDRPISGPIIEVDIHRWSEWSAS